MSSSQAGSGPATKRREQKAATRLKLKKAAMDCFRELGYRKVGITEITRQAGVAQGTFYVHFANKEELVDELLTEFNDSLAAELAPLFAGDRAVPIPELVDRAASAFLDHWEQNRDLVECVAQRSAAGIELENLRDGLNPPMVNLLAGALARVGEVLGVEADWNLTTQAILGMWLRIGLQILFNPAVEREAARQTLVKLTTGAVGAVLSGNGS